MSEQGFRGVPGVPDGWELVGIRPISEDWTIGSDGKPMFYEGGLTTTWWPVIRKIEQAPKYRAFESAEEFKPHRDRWWYRHDICGRIWFPPQYYDDRSHGGATYKYRFETCFFEDGSPFGVKIDGN
jgi:hypothetical protein